MIGCNHTSFEWTRAVRHIYGIKGHMQGLYRAYITLPASPGRVFAFCKVSHLRGEPRTNSRINWDVTVLRRRGPPYLSWTRALLKQ